MKLINVSIGTKGSSVKYTEDKGIGFIQETSSRQKLKIVSPRPGNTGLKYLRANVVDGTDIVVDTYCYDDDVRYFPTLHSLSFNPYLYPVKYDGKPETELVFITINSKEYTMLSYDIGPEEVLNTHVNKKDSVISCIIRYQVGAIIFIYLKNNKNGEIVRLIIDTTLPNPIDEAVKITEEECKYKNVDTNRKTSLRFGFNAREIPRYVLCYDNESDDILNYVYTKYHISKTSMIPIVVNENIDLNDSVGVVALLGAELSRTKAIIISPNMQMPRETSLSLGLKYVFKAFKNKDNEFTGIKIVLNN